MKKKYCFDIDGVICKTIGNNDKNSKPILIAINKINKLYEEGNYIIIFTARFMGRSKENKKIAKKKGLKITQTQLKKWGVLYHKLEFGKPSFDLVIDDKSLFFKKNWHNLI